MEATEFPIYLIYFKGSFKAVEKGCSVSLTVCERGTIFYGRVTKKGKGLDLWVESHLISIFSLGFL